MTSAQSSMRALTRTIASSSVPADRTSRSLRLQKMRSAVALRWRLRRQMKRTRFGRCRMGHAEFRVILTTSPHGVIDPNQL